MAIMLVDVYTGIGTNITEQYKSHKQEGPFNVRVNFKRSLKDGKWVDDEYSKVYEDCYISMIP